MEKAAYASAMNSLTKDDPHFEIQLSSWSSAVVSAGKRFLSLSGLNAALCLAKCCCHICYSPVYAQDSVSFWFCYVLVLFFFLFF